MAYLHPDRATSFTRAAAAAHHEMFIRGRAQQIEATERQERKRKLENLCDDDRAARGGFALQGIHTDTPRRKTGAGNREEDSVQSFKRPYLDPNI